MNTKEISDYGGLPDNLKAIFKGNAAWPQDFKILANSDSSVIYFVQELPSQNGFAQIAWSRLSRVEDEINLFPMIEVSVWELPHYVKIFEIKEEVGAKCTFACN